MAYWGDVLIADDDPEHTRALVAEFTRAGARSCTCFSKIDAALAGLEAGISLLIASMQLSPRGCLSLIHAANRLRPRPMILVVGDTTEPSRIAECAAQGADMFALKPVHLAGIKTAIKSEIDSGMERLARLLVGRVGLKEAQQHLRLIMATEAVTRTHGSRRAAAELLSVDRAYVRRLARELPESGEHVTALGRS